MTQTLPDGVTTAHAKPMLKDPGFVQRSAGGGASTFIDRPGARFAAEISFPPLRPEKARALVTRLQQARGDGLSLRWPLLGAGQGIPGTPTVDGALAAGTSLPVKGLNPGYAAKEGYWLSIRDADGVSYLHQVTALVVADGTGDATMAVWPPLRGVFVDGDDIELRAPVIEGLVTSDIEWELPANRIVTPPSITIEEVA